jgi:hypothetical protein
MESKRSGHKPHKFFERFLENDLERLTWYLVDQYQKIDSGELNGVTALTDHERTHLGVAPSMYQPEIKPWISSGSLSTVKWTEYNVFQFYDDQVHTLYKNVSDMVKEACVYYDIDFDSQKYYIQGWFNINHSHVGKLSWHDHGGPYAPFFHGYYSVSAEPSITHYKLFNDDSMIVENHNINNRAIVSEMGQPHAMGDWDWEGPRITIAYDIVPLSLLQSNNNIVQQHWIPLF